MNGMRRRYRLYGLRIDSDIELPELFVADDGPVDIRITRGSIAPATLGARAGTEITTDGVRFAVGDKVRFHVRDGTSIIVDALPMSDPRDVRLYLLGSAIGILIHQRGLLPLHANAIELGGGAVAFAGESGAGKSTLAAWFHDRGARIVADDVCVVKVGREAQVEVLPGLPRLRLWREALERSGRDAADHPRSFSGNPDYDKFDVAIDDKTSVDRPLPLRAIFLLERGSSFEIVEQRGIEALNTVIANTYRGSFVQAAEASRNHYHNCIAVVRHVPVLSVRRRWGYDDFERQACALADFAERLGSASTDQPVTDKTL